MTARGTGVGRGGKGVRNVGCGLRGLLLAVPWGLDVWGVVVAFGAGVGRRAYKYVVWWGEKYGVC